MQQEIQEFQPFDKSDWDAFSGCESVDPWIHHGDAFVTIQDDETVQVHVDVDDDEQTTWSYTFPTNMIAVAVGRAIINNLVHYSEVLEKI